MRLVFLPMDSLQNVERKLSVMEKRGLYLAGMCHVPVAGEPMGRLLVAVSELDALNVGATDPASASAESSQAPASASASAAAGALPIEQAKATTTVEITTPPPKVEAVAPPLVLVDKGSNGASQLPEPQILPPGN